MLSQLIDSISSWKTVILFGLITAGAFWFLTTADPRVKSEDVLDLRFQVWNLNSAYEYFKQLGPSACESYKNIETKQDIIYPICYSLFFTILISTLYKDSKLSFLKFIPLISAIFDFSENFILYQLLSSYPTRNADLEQLASIGSIFTQLKLFLLPPIILIVVFGIISNLCSTPKHKQM